jgi:hypothetical protein
MNFAPVATLEELDGLDFTEIVAGYSSAERGDPEPGPNRGKAFWHGWCCRMRDYRLLPPDPVHTELVRLYVERSRARGRLLQYAGGPSK